MRIVIIGRTEILFNTALILRGGGHNIVCIVSAKEAPESTKTASDFRELANTWEVPFIQSTRLEEHASILQEVRADIAVSINFTGIVPESVVQLFPLGILNAHGGDLPRYRGNACQAWAIINGEDRIGLCIHKMIGGELDSGDIITRDYMQIDHATKITNVWEWMSLRIPELMLEAVKVLGSNPEYILEKQDNDTKLALRCYPRQPEDGRIDWAKSAIDIVRLINASNKPYAGAYCDFRGKKMIIWDAELVEDEEIFCAVPGQVLKIGNDSVEIACGQGRVRLLSVEYENTLIAPQNELYSIRMRLK